MKNIRREKHIKYFKIKYTYVENNFRMKLFSHRVRAEKNKIEINLVKIIDSYVELKVGIKE